MTQSNIAYLRARFPHCITETHDGDGNMQLAVDFDLLRQELSAEAVEGDEERFRLDWPGKRKALLAANTPTSETLRPCRTASKAFDTTQNLFIEGDNLTALKLLQETYLGKIKCIYIDPPYNTGGDFIYRDNFAQDRQQYLLDSGQIDAEGVQLVSNPETSGRYHSDWLSMIMPRLRLARNLLRDDGVIFVSIDDHEVHNLIALLDSVFDRSNKLAILKVQMSGTQGMKVAAAKKGKIVKNAEYVLCYARDATCHAFRRPLYEPKGWDTHYDTYIDPTSLQPIRLKAFLKEDAEFQQLCCEQLGEKLPKIDTKRLYTEHAWFREFIHRHAENIYLTSMLDAKIALTDAQHATLTAGGIVRYEAAQRTYTLRYAGKAVLRQMIPLAGALGETDGFAPHFGLRTIRGDWWPDFHRDMMNITRGDELPFKNGKKPLRLLRELLAISTADDDIVLDFFAGSGTTAVACMAQNAADGARRRFIAVQLPEPVPETIKGIHTIAELAQERLRRAGAQLQQPEIPDLDVGFRVLKTASSHFAAVALAPGQYDQQNLAGLIDNIKPDRTPEDLLVHVMLEYGLDLALPIHTETAQGFTLLRVGDNALLACFDPKLSEAIIQHIARAKPQRALFRDHGFASDAAMINAKQLLAQTAPTTQVRVL